jgi:hypothetical protein
MLKQLLFSLCCGLLSVVVIAQYDPWIKELVAEQICRSSPQLLAGRLSCTCADISLIHGTITLRNVCMEPLDELQKWHWQAERLQVQYSWWQLLCYGTLDFYNELDDLTAYVHVVDKKLDIADHLEHMFGAPSNMLYSFLRSLRLRNATVHIHDAVIDMYTHMTADIELNKVGNCFKSTIDVYDGGLRYQQRPLFERMGGSLQLDLFDGKPYLDMCLGGAASVAIAQLGPESTPCQISCSWQHNRGIFSIKNVDHTFVIDPVIVKKDHHGYAISIAAQLPLHYMWRMARETKDDDDYRIAGACSFELKYNNYNNQHQLHGHAVAQRIACNDTHIGSLAKMSFHAKDQLFEGDFYIQRTSGACAVGNWQFDPRNISGMLHLKNSARLSLSPEHDWRILPDDGTCAITLHEDKKVEIAYDVKATHAKTNDTLASAGNLIVDGDDLYANGTFDRATYAVNACFKPDIMCKKLHIAREQQTLCSCERDAETYTGFIDVALIKEILKRYRQFNLQGEGQFKFKLKENAGMYSSDIHLENGAIRLPRTYNFVNGFDAHITVNKEYEVEVKDLFCTLHNGKLSSSFMRAAFTQDFALRSCYLPIIIEHCLFNMENELFAMVSGDLLFYKKEKGSGLLQGNILLDRAQLKGNIFSDVLQKNMRSFTAHSLQTGDEQVKCEIKIQTKNPIKIQTPFLVTDARIDLLLNQTVRNPVLTGSVQLQGGQLNFPYRPLYVSKGALHFMPGRLEDPLIELVAKNNIKKNNIVLQAIGSLQDHQITLESSPTLSEEQIISLLLVGSQEESLNVVMPALLMQNIKSILFGYDQSTSALSRYFNNFLKPFRRIHLVPSFVDRSGRGGLRGAIEIDISDRWRAIIEKNFSLTEDTRFELEYLFSDDISMRVVRDIRRDLIAEVETRWKFGSR